MVKGKHMTRTPMPSPLGTNRERLFVNSRRRGAAYDENPDDRRETMNQFLRRVGVSQDAIDAFHHMVEAVNTGSDPHEQHAEDDQPTLSEAVSALQNFITEKMSTEDAQECHHLIGGILNAADKGPNTFNGGEGEDALPTGPGGTGLPKNRMQVEGRQAMDSARITTGTDSFGHGYDRGRVPMPADRKPKSDAAKFAPGISRIVIGV
jgi:hypothetical protein